MGAVLDTAAAGLWEIETDRARIAVPIFADRCPEATTTVAVAFARQTGLGIEFVAATDNAHRARREAVARARCQEAAAAGAERVAWQVVAGGPDEVASYVTWSGASLCCVGLPAHRPHVSIDLSSAIPVLVVGPVCRTCARPVERVVVGLGGSWRRSEALAAAASSLAVLLDVELTMIEVIEPGRPLLDVPASAHLHWVAEAMPRPRPWFDTIAARRAEAGLARFLGPSSLAVVGTPEHHRQLLGGVAGRLLRRSPCPVVVVPAPA
jgi:nucleotide-binding universal stress UspA family protein